MKNFIFCLLFLLGLVVFTPAVYSQVPASEEVLQLLEGERYSEAYAKFDSWEAAQPEDKNVIEAYRSLADQLEREPSPENRSIILMHYRSNGFEDSMHTLQEADELLKDKAGIRQIPAP